MTIIKKFEPEEPKKEFSKKYLGLIAFFLLLLTLVEIWISNTIVSYGEKFEKLSSLQQTLNLENQILENEIAKHTSLSTIASKSAALGFSKLDSIKYIR